MRIGVPKETKTLEGRVALVPAACGDLVKAGHEVYVESTAGMKSGFSDSDFVAVNAIRQALKNRNMAQLLQAAEDMLNLLAQDGIYMDDLKLAPTSAPQWRAFASGRRGPDVAAVGSIHDESMADPRMKTPRRQQSFKTLGGTIHDR